MNRRSFPNRYLLLSIHAQESKIMTTDYPDLPRLYAELTAVADRLTRLADRLTELISRTESADPAIFR